MAKKDVQAELSQEELEAKFSEGEDNKKEPKKIKIKGKNNFSLDDYKERVQTNLVSFKEQTWIKMSEAFQEITGLPGCPGSYYFSRREIRHRENDFID